MPVLGGKCRKKSIAASNPPADPPTPTIGHIRFALAGSGLAFALDNFDCDNFLPLVFVREGAALDLGFRFAAMGLFYVSCAWASHKLRLQGGTRCPQRVDKLSAALPPDICAFGDSSHRLRRSRSTFDARLQTHRLSRSVLRCRAVVKRIASDFAFHFAAIGRVNVICACASQN